MGGRPCRCVEFVRCGRSCLCQHRTSPPRRRIAISLFGPYASVSGGCQCEVKEAIGCRGRVCGIQRCRCRCGDGGTLTVASDSTQKMSPSNQINQLSGSHVQTGQGTRCRCRRGPSVADSARTTALTVVSASCGDDHTRTISILQRGWIAFVCCSRITSNEEVCVSTLLLGPAALTRLHTQGAMTPNPCSSSHKAAAGSPQASN